MESSKKSDEMFMNIALKEAKIALRRGDFPVGAVLVINGKIAGKSRNSMHTGNNWASHAEAKLLQKESRNIRIKTAKGNKRNIVLYTTLEPCLMCLGTSLLHNVSKIVFACPDPHGGSTNINFKGLPDFYIRRWPKIIGGLLQEESCKLLIDFLKTQNDKTSKKILALYKKM